MEISGINTPTVVTPAEAQAQRSSLSGDLESFLKLLITQLKNQDPLEPLNATDFTAQLAQFAAVEQGIKTNKNLESLISMSKTGQVSAAVSYLGKVIEAEGNKAPLANGKVEFSYILDKPAAIVSVTVFDDKGRAVFSTTGETSLGSHTFIWDGVDTNGNTLTDGIYTLAVGALDKEKNPVGVTTRFKGLVDGADTSGDTIKLSVGGVTVPLDKILSVRDPKET